LSGLLVVAIARGGQPGGMFESSHAALLSSHC
jgi:hypothetical protein